MRVSPSGTVGNVFDGPLQRDPGRPLDIPAALRTEVFRLPPLAKAGRIELAQSRLRLGAPTLEERLKDDQ